MCTCIRRPFIAPFLSSVPLPIVYIMHTHNRGVGSYRSCPHRSWRHHRPWQHHRSRSRSAEEGCSRAGVHRLHFRIVGSVLRLRLYGPRGEHGSRTIPVPSNIRRPQSTIGPFAATPLAEGLVEHRFASVGHQTDEGLAGCRLASVGASPVTLRCIDSSPTVRWWLDSQAVADASLPGVAIGEAGPIGS